MFIISALKIIFLLGFLILIHELGHFLAARLCKVKVNEFAIGFGPTIWKKETKETKYALRLLPLGGFCNMEGEEHRSDAEGSFSKANIFKRIVIVLAGAIVNIIFAVVVYFIIVGYFTELPSTTIDYVAEEYAETSVFLPNDKIKTIDGHKIRLKSDIDKYVRNSNGEILEIELLREGNLIKLSAAPYLVNDTIYVLGINIKMLDGGFGERTYFAFWETTDFIVSIGESLQMLFTGKVSVDQLTGPIGISNMAAQTNGVKEFIYLLALISLSLGVTNLLPFPPLDGGKVVILIIEGIRKKPMKENIEIGIQMVGFGILILLSIYVSYKDVLRIF